MLYAPARCRCGRAGFIIRRVPLHFGFFATTLRSRGAQGWVPVPANAGAVKETARPRVRTIGRSLLMVFPPRVTKGRPPKRAPYQNCDRFQIKLMGNTSSAANAGSKPNSKATAVVVNRRCMGNLLDFSPKPWMVSAQLNPSENQLFRLRFRSVARLPRHA
jgi:hypothetical protein